jgi:ribonuclease HII
MTGSCILELNSYNPACCDLSFERLVETQGYHRIAGIDEVGRGALFGPVYAAAVILDLSRVPDGINDSKKLTVKKRLRLAENIRETALGFCIACVDSETIDRINILEATREAMREAIRGLQPPPDYLLCDAIVIGGLNVPQKSIIHGDARSVSIAAASILAKVERDKVIAALGSRYPGYDLESNKGYGTATHLRALRALGPTPFHRKTFRGVCQRSEGLEFGKIIA